MSYYKSTEEGGYCEKFDLGRMPGLEYFYIWKSISWRDLPTVKLPKELFDGSNKYRGQWVVQQMQFAIDILKVKDLWIRS